MASLYELIDPSKLTYDTVLGRTVFDSGGGPPTNLGWMRSGSAGSGGENCNGWVISSSGQTGTQAQLWLPGYTSSPTDPWTTFQILCNSPRNVWCMED